MNKDKNIAAAPSASAEIGMIAKNTKVLGNITTEGHLDVEGSVEGNIDVKGNLRIAGRVSGDVTCSSLLLQTGRQAMDISAADSVKIEQKSVVEGSLRCKNINIEGRVTGDISASEIVRIASTGIIEGNIETARLAISEGAQINGRIKMLKIPKEKSKLPAVEEGNRDQ